jgi:hypothetical protein
MARRGALPFILGSASQREVAPLLSILTGVLMKLSPLFAAAAAATLLLAGPAFAQSTAAPAAKSETAAPAKTMKKMSKARSPESMECSKQADAKGLHGKERKKFRSDCIKNAKAGEKAK